MCRGTMGNADRFASFGCGEEALEMPAKRAYELLVCDKRMPGMHGAAVLTQAERFPQAARIILI